MARNIGQFAANNADILGRPTMLPTALIAILLLEIGYCLIFGYFMLGDGMAQRLDELSICILVYLIAVRVALVLATFLAAHALNPVQPPMSTSARLRMMAKESVATLLAFSLLIPLSFFLAPRLKNSKSTTVVLMVHGFMSNSGIWWWLARQLRRQGITGLDSLNLSPMFGDIDQYVAQLNKRIMQLRSRGVNHVFLIGHSMGGLVCRAWLQSRTTNGVTADGLQCQLLTLCTPWFGTRIARFIPWKNLVQMAHRSAWVLAHSARPDFRALALYSAHDNVVIPYTSGFDQSIESSELRALGHLSVLFEPGIADEILERLRSWPAVKDA